MGRSEYDVKAGGEIRQTNGLSIISFSPESIKPPLRSRIINRLLNFAQPVVSKMLFTSDELIKRQMAHIGFEVIDLYCPQESRYSHWDLVTANNEIQMIAMIRSGKEHNRLRRFCHGPKEQVEKYIAAVPELLRTQSGFLPDEIPLVVNADDFTIEEVNSLLIGRYHVEEQSAETFIKAFVDNESFDQVPPPQISSNVSLQRIMYQDLSKKARQQIRDFYREIQGDQFSFKIRSLKAPGAYFAARNVHDQLLLGMAGILAQDNTNEIMPISLAGDLGVRLDARGQGIGEALRWVNYKSVFLNPVFSKGIVTSIYAENNAAQHILVRRQGGKEVSRTLWAVLKKN